MDRVRRRLSVVVGGDVGDACSLFVQAPKLWGVPCVPWLPSLSIATNLFLMGSLGYKALRQIWYLHGGDSALLRALRPACHLRHWRRTTTTHLRRTPSDSHSHLYLLVPPPPPPPPPPLLLLLLASYTDSISIYLFFLFRL